MTHDGAERAAATADAGLARAIDRLWVACVLSIAFQRVWELPITGNKLQPPELVGALLIVAAGVHVLRGHRLRPFARLDLGALAWWLAVTVVWLLLIARGHASRTVQLDWIGTTYLVLVYFALRVTASRARLRRSVPSLIGMGLIAAAASMLGFAGTVAGYEMPNVLIVEFPYLGRVIRSSGFTPYPAMVASIVITAFVAWIALRIIEPHRALAKAWVPGLLLATFLLTQSKAGVALACGLLAWWLFHASSARWHVRVPVLAALCLLVAIYIFGSHVVIIRADAQAELTQALVEEKHIAEAPLGTIRVFGTDLTLFRSNYWMNKRASLLAIEASWPIGFGHGGQREYVRRLMREGRHPSTLWAADPHSTYVGTVAELGLAGTLALTLLAACLIADVRPLRRASDRTIAALSAVLAAAVVTVAIECITTDVMNFRHYWIALGLIASAAAAATAPAATSTRVR